NETGEAIIFRHLPTACVCPEVTSVVPPGSYLSVPLLLRELQSIDSNSARVAIDPHAWVVLDSDAAKEAELSTAIGSTATGTGAALIRRIQRLEIGSFAKDVPDLKPFIRC